MLKEWRQSVRQGDGRGASRVAIFSISPSLSLLLFQIESSLAEEEGSTQLGFPSLLTQVMVLHTGDYTGAKCWGCKQGRSPWQGELIPAHCSLSVDKADSCN